MARQERIGPYGPIFVSVKHQALHSYPSHCALDFFYFASSPRHHPGNVRYCLITARHPDIGKKYLLFLPNSQHPFYGEFVHMTSLP